ncbi:MAG: oxygen-independent coproporphyrinogen-3 oxidase [Chlamydiales bacterium]|jgi:oxygen-independent coproporphyrinogen-3 oxidase
MTDETSMAREPEGTDDPTTVGNVFISNYPPFSFWSTDEVSTMESVLAGAPSDDRPLGIYVHIPFCRKRCDFCYFKVYIDKNSKEIRRYLDAVGTEARTLAARPYLAGRKPRFVYFGGGTPSYLSADQMRSLLNELKDCFDWSEVEEVTYECEPGTLSLAKIEALREVGVTRLSLGVENFDPEILKINNRAHGAEEIDRTYAFAREVGFPSINIDLIAGMVGETDENWRRCIERVVAMRPESLTVYQIEIPYNTTLYSRMKDTGAQAAPVAGWETKRRWSTEIFDRLAQEGYHQSSAYTACRSKDISFVYRDALWHGADMLGLGVSSFSHLGGQHAQNEHTFERYIERVEAGELPIIRALTLGQEERLIREFILQLKQGALDVAYFKDKFGVDPIERFRAPLEQHRDAGFLTFDDQQVRTTALGLQQVDGLLPAFYLERHQDARYA